MNAHEVKPLIGNEVRRRHTAQGLFGRLTTPPHAQYFATGTVLLAVMMVVFALERERIQDLESDDWAAKDSPYDLECNEWDDVKAHSSRVESGHVIAHFGACRMTFTQLVPVLLTMVGRHCAYEISWRHFCWGLACEYVSSFLLRHRQQSRGVPLCN